MKCAMLKKIKNPFQIVNRAAMKSLDENWQKIKISYVFGGHLSIVNGCANYGSTAENWYEWEQIHLFLIRNNINSHKYA